RAVLPVSTLQHGLYGVADVCLSVPTVVGCGGARQQLELPLTPKERLGVQNSARVLREVIDQVEARVGKVGAGEKAAPAKPQPAPVPVPVRGVTMSAPANSRPIPRAAWQRAR